MRVLIVDDDPGLRLALTKALGRKGVDVVDLASGEAALEPLRTGMCQGPIDVCILDLRMPGLSGLDVLRRTPQRRVPVVVLTGHGTVPDAVEAMRLGAAHFVQKPVDADMLLPVLQQVLKEDPQAPSTMLGASDAMLTFLEKLDRAALTDDPVLLVGETGTGRELSARRLHELARKRGAFVSLSSAAVSKDLFEIELFGANETREGLIQKAGEGTLFIDEVGDLPLDTQGKLQRALEEKRYRAVGSSVDKPFRARLVAATSRDLKPLTEKGGPESFRADLFYRLSVLLLHVPPLRDRGDDVVLIARAALGRSADRPVTLTRAAEERLCTYRFPGNVRELVNLMKRAALFSPHDTVDVDLIDELLAESPYAGGDGLLDPGPRAGQRVTLEELEKTHIRRLLSELKNVSEVARIVGIDRRTLQRKMAAWGFRDA